MKEQFDVLLPASFAIPENKEQLTIALETLFYPDGAVITIIASAVQYENKPKFGPSAISNLRFGVVRYDPDALRGRLRLFYDMQLTFGCEDVIKTLLNQHSYYNFKILPEQALLHFESDIPESLSTADEF